MIPALHAERHWQRTHLGQRYSLCMFCLLCGMDPLVRCMPCLLCAHHASHALGAPANHRSGAVRAGGGTAAPAAAKEEAKEDEEEDEERAAWSPERRTAEELVAVLVEQWRKPMCGARPRISTA